MAAVKVPRSRISDGSLPPVCVVCGAHADHYLFSYLRSPSLAWAFVSPLIGLLAFWCCLLSGDAGSGTFAAGFPFCNRHRGYWPRRARIIVVGFILVVLFFSIAFALVPREAESHWLFGLAGFSLLIYMPTLLILQLFSVRPTSTDRESVTLSCANRKFAAAMASVKAHG
jgi:hypothetical protein